jgi:hypothetical protein
MAKVLFLCTMWSACLLLPETLSDVAGFLAASEIASRIISFSASVVTGLFDWVGSHADVDSDFWLDADTLESTCLVMAASWISYAGIDGITSLAAHSIRPGSIIIAWGRSRSSDDYALGFD